MPISFLAGSAFAASGLAIEAGQDDPREGALTPATETAATCFRKGRRDALFKGETSGWPYALVTYVPALLALFATGRRLCQPQAGPQEWGRFSFYSYGQATVESAGKLCVVPII